MFYTMSENHRTLNIIEFSCDTLKKDRVVYLVQNTIRLSVRSIIIHIHRIGRAGNGCMKFLRKA